MLEFINFIIIAGIVIHVLLLGFLFKQAHKNKWTASKRILFIFFSFTLFVSIHFYAQSHDFIIPYLITYVPADLIEWVLGPLLFLYVRSVFTNHHFSKTNDKIHFIPAVIVLLGLTVPIFISILKDQIIFSYLDVLIEHSSIYVIIRNSYFLCYLLFTYKLLLRLKQFLSSYYSFNREKELRWIKHLLIGALLVTCVDLISELYEVFIQPLSWDSGFISVIFMIVLVVYLGYHGINQSSMLLPDFIWEENETKTIEKSQKETDINVELIQVLETAMTIEKPFLNETLTLGQLATQINTTDKKLSNLLNQQMNIGFYDYINEYRIRHFIELLKSEDNLKTLTLFSLAQESGFKSKATFHRVFKKHYNTTPSEYLAQVK